MNPPTVDKLWTPPLLPQGLNHRCPLDFPIVHTGSSCYNWLGRPFSPSTHKSSHLSGPGGGDSCRSHLPRAQSMRLPQPRLLLGFPWESSSHTESKAPGIKAQLSASKSRSRRREGGRRLAGWQATRPSGSPRSFGRDTGQIQWGSEQSWSMV